MKTFTTIADCIFLLSTTFWIIWISHRILKLEKKGSDISNAQPDPTAKSGIAAAKTGISDPTSKTGIAKTL